LSDHRVTQKRPSKSFHDQPREITQMALKQNMWPDICELQHALCISILTITILEIVSNHNGRRCVDTLYFFRLFTLTPVKPALLGIGVNLRIFLVLISAYKTDAALERHSREGENPGVARSCWTHAFAGVTGGWPALHS
jgi:hypothetical protein